MVQAKKEEVLFEYLLFFAITKCILLLPICYTKYVEKTHKLCTSCITKNDNLIDGRVTELVKCLFTILLLKSSLFLFNKQIALISRLFSI